MGTFRMTLDELYAEVRKLTEYIDVLEAEKVSEQFIMPLYNRRHELLNMLIKAEQ